MGVKKIRVAAPGRINLIGEHIDYNGGLVLPAAISHRIYMEFSENGSREAVIKSMDYDTFFTVDVDDVSPSNTEWHNYILGVIHHINQLRPGSLKGFDCIIKSELPMGSGISSSAALECGIAKGLNELFKLGLTDIELVTLSRDAEHSYVGTKCGIMDQFAVVMGKKDHFVKLDCNSLAYDYIPTHLGDYELLLLNSNVSHSLATSEYNTRREECGQALATIQEKYPQYQNLADVPEAVILEFQGLMTPEVYDRALYVTQENKRVLQACEALYAGDLIALGNCLYGSHKGLSKQYEVSCPELDFMVDFSQEEAAVLGARMMGGGFGGCTINLIRKEAIPAYVSALTKAYQAKFDIQPTPIHIVIGNGVSIQQ